MTKSYNPSSRWQWVWMSIPFVVVLLVLALSARAQEGSLGNTTIFGGAQMTFFGNHNFLTGGGGSQPGVIGTVRTAPFGILNFATSASATTGSNDANHVDGYVRKFGTDQFIFPTGDNAHYGPFAATADGTMGAYFFVDPTSAVTSNLAGGNYPALPTGGPFPSATKAASLSAVSTREYWDIDGTNATRITLTYSTSSAVGTLTGNTLSRLTIAGWNGTQWVRIPSTVDATSVLGGASALTAGSITTTATLTPNTYTAYTLAAYVGSPTINPDNNVTYVNVPVPGNLSTNDKVPTGTTYGTPTASTNNPAVGSITVNPDGTYSFSTTTPGSYTYTVPVCPPGQTTGCPTSLLVIKALPSPDNGLSSPTSPAPPVANIDVASVKGDPTSPASVTVNVRANDKPSNPGGTLGTPSITGQPTHGTASVGPDGNIIYTPQPGYYGEDVLTYQVCESPSGLCTTAQEVIQVLESDNTTIASDDYAPTPYNTPVTGNVKDNDSDPEGNTQTVTAQTTTSPAGSLTLNADGSFRFVPAPGFSGPASFSYTTCDNGTPQACANATIYVLVAPPTVSSILNPDNNVTYVNVPVPGNVSTNDKVPAGTTYGTPTASTGNPTGGTITLNPDGTYSFTGTTPGSYTYTVPVCAPGQTTGCPTTPLVIKVLPDPITTPGNLVPPVANIDVTSVKGSPTSPPSVTLNVRANDKPANPGGTLGNPTIITPPAHGTASVDPSGNIVYTPNPGYYGDDVLTYQVCESPSGLCTTAQEVIHVLPSINTTVANDDYVTTAYNTPVTGNVKTNDSDPEGNTQTVTAQTTTTSAGSLTLNTDGSFRFVPTASYSGTASFSYTTCDNGTPQACANATIYILVAPQLPVPDLTPTIYTRPSPVYGTSPITVVVDVNELLGVATRGLITVKVTKDDLTSLSFAAGTTTLDGRSVQNSLWSFDGSSDPNYYILTTNSVVSASGKLTFGLSGTLTPGGTSGTLAINAVIVGGSGSETRINNNVGVNKIDYFQK